MVEQLRHVERLDLGESEAIVVAIELGMRLVVDERRGHRVAQVHGVAVFGTTRVVVDAVRAGFIAIDEVEPLLRRMAAADFWLSERIIRLTVAQARQ
ncbi:MAG: DUF3368 domain-containing protein [Chloroflexi bacterium]|nr:DUF3368 domain-containing protein [Chloroflexota bacterium]